MPQRFHTDDCEHQSRATPAAPPPVPLPSATDAGTLLGSVASQNGGEATALAHLYVSDAGAALRTLLGDAHRHVIGTYPSWKTGLPQPYEGLGEQALIEESEIRHDIVDYQTQAFRLRLMLGAARVEWICDHLRQYADGTIEAIEVKQHLRQMDEEYIAKIQRAREILARLGWTLRVRYEEEIIGCEQGQRNRAEILAHRSAHISQRQWATFNRMRRASSIATYAAVRDALDTRPLQGKAVMHRLICAGRIAVDLQHPIRDLGIVELLPAPRFTSKIRF